MPENLNGPLAATAPGAAPPAPISRQTYVNWPQMACAALGFALSLYAYHVHLLILAGEKTGCAITETISCDQVIGSKYGVVFGIPLGIYGAAFFGVMAIMAISSTGNTRAAALQRLLLALAGGAGSVVLEFIMWALLHHACPVCMSIHLVCFVNLGLAVVGYGRVLRAEGRVHAL